MADITDIKSIIYTEKSLALGEKGFIVVQTSTRVTKTSLRNVFKEYFGVNLLKVNSLNQSGKTKKFRSTIGKRNDFKKFYVTLPEGTHIESLSV